jgi:hypothetical protein
MGFSGCSALKNLELPNLVYAGDMAFGECVLLESLYVPVLGKVGNCVFYLCN